jgi:hypothetical protein
MGDPQTRRRALAAMIAAGGQSGQVLNAGWLFSLRKAWCVIYGFLQVMLS